MKQRLLSITTILILGIFAQNIWAQTPIKVQPTAIKTQRIRAKAPDTTKNTDPSLRGQYLFMLSRSKSLNGYKLINPSRLSTVWQSVNDTLRKERVELNASKNKIIEQQKTITNLQADVNGKESSLSTSNAKANEINFLGIAFSKGSYNIMVWSIIIILGIALFIVIAKSAKNVLEARHRTQLYDEISTEYQNYKAKANEKERKLARELQDERNIIEEMKSKGKSS